MTRTGHLRRLRAGSGVAAVLLLAACTAGAKASEPTWRPKPSFSGENGAPGPLQPAPGGASPNQPAAPRTPGSSSATKQLDPSVVATNLSAPTGIAIMPDHTALVGERTTGRIVRVQPIAGQPVRTVRTITGLSTVGDGGLLDLALSPNYAEDNLIFAYVTTPTDNRVVDFTLTGPVTPVLIGIPRGTTDNTGRIAFAVNGDLLVGTGDAGRAADAANPKSLAGKVLRVSDIGAPAAGNPTRGSRVYTSGQRVVNGLCTGATGQIVEVETRPGVASDPINLLQPGASYGWPRRATGYRVPAKTMPAAAQSPGGCAILDSRLFVTSRDATQLLSAQIGIGQPALGVFSASLRKRYGRLLTVSAASDGSLWLTTTNRDGHGSPVPTDERVLRIVPSGASTNPA